MPGNVRLGGAYFAFTADARGYERGANQAIAANRRLAASYGQFAVQLQGTQALAGQFAQSLRSSLLATAAYAAGVGLVSSSLRGIVGGFLEYDRGLIRISKTTGIAGDALDRLGQRVEALGTGPSGLRPALPVLREELFQIAVAAGQAGVQTSAGIARITRAAGELQVSSNLIGSDAVRALTRYLQVTGQSIERTDAIASAYTHLGNNIVGTEAEIASFATRVAQNLSAVGSATDEFIIGVASTLTELDVQQEAAGSALQRTQIALLRLAGDPSRFHAFADAIGGTSEEVEALRQRFVDGTASAQDFDRVFTAFLRKVRDTGPTQRQSFIADIIGGGEANVRNTRVIGVLAERYDRLQRNIGLAGEATEQANFQSLEAARAAEAQSSALQIVSNRMEEQGTAIGRHVNPALIAIAQNFEVVELAAVAALTAFGAGAIRRRVGRFRASQIEAAKASDSARSSLAAQRAEIVRLDQTVRRSATARRAYTASFAREAVARQQLTAATGAQVAAANRLAGAEARAQRVRDRFTRDGARGGVFAVSAQGDPARVRALRNEVARAEREVARQQAAVSAAQSQRTATGIANSAAYRRAVMQETGARARLNQVRAQAAAAQRAVNRQMRLGARLARGFGSVVNFLGGPLGLLTTALTVGTTAWLLWGNRSDEARDRLRDLNEELSQTVESLQQQGLTASGALLGRAETELAALEERAASLRNQLGGRTDRQAFRTGLGDELSELRDVERDIAELEENIERLRTAMAAAGDSARDMAQTATQSFRRLPVSLLPAVQAVRNYQEALERAAAADLARARIERDTVGLGVVAQRTALEIAEQRAQITEYQIGLDTQLRDLRVRTAEAERRVAAATSERDRLEIGTEARQQAEAQLTTAERQLRTLQDQVAVLAERERLSNRVAATEEAIARRVRIERETEIRQRLQEQPVPEQADARFRVDEAAQELRARQRTLRQQEVVDIQARAAASAREEAALRASLPVLQEYYARQEEQAQAIALTTGRLEEAQRVRDEQRAAIERALVTGREVRDAELDQLDASRQRVATLRAERDEQLFTARALQESAAGYEELANAQAEIARAAATGPLDELAAQANRLNDQLEAVAARGFDSLTDSIVDLAIEGKASFNDLAESIARDLLRVLAQARIVAPIIQALTAFAPGLFSFGGGGGPVVPGFFHSGGVAPRDALRLPRPQGLRSDEFPAVLQRGEVVVPRGLARRARYGGAAGLDELAMWWRSLPRFHAGGVAGAGRASVVPGGGGGVTRIELVNQSNTQLEAVDNGTRLDGEDYVRSVVLRDARSNGPITRALLGQSGRR